MMLSADTTSAILSITAPAILAAGAIDDLRSRKFHNWLFLTCTAAGLSANVMHNGFSGLGWALLAFGAGFLAMLPLVVFRVVGAGDLKLLAAFGAATTWPVVLAVAFYALFWGALFGVFRAVAQGRGTTLAFNLIQIAGNSGKSDRLQLNRIPYSVAFVFGWLTHLTIGGFA